MIDFSTWPPTAADLARLQGYRLREQLFRSDFKTAFASSSAYIPRGMRKKLYLAADWPRLISLGSADMLLAETPILSQGEQQDQLAQFLDDTNFWRECYQGALSCSYRGDTVLSLSVSEDSQGWRPFVTATPADAYFVEHDPDNGRRVLSEALAWIREDSKGQLILRVDHHFPGRIVREAWLVRRSNLYVVAPLMDRVRNVKIDLSELYENPPEAEEITGVPRSLLFHIPNYTDDTCYFGFSDYTEALISNFDGFNERLTEVHRILSKHADPKMYVPSGTLDVHGRLKKSLGEVFEVPENYSGQAPVGYVTWNGQLDSAFRDLEYKADLILKFSESSNLDFGKDRPISVDSSSAMKLLFLAPIRKTTRKKLYWNSIRDVVYWGQYLAAISGVAGYKKPTAKPKVQWQDGLPHNYSEAVQTEATRVAARLTSRSEAIRRIDQISEQAAADELARIDAEAPPTSPNPPQPPEM